MTYFRLAARLMYAPARASMRERERRLMAAKRLIFVVAFAFASGVFAAYLTAGAAEHQPVIDAATKAANAWLKLVDAGDYGQSWDAASSMFKNAVPRAEWSDKVAQVRGPLGAVVSRKRTHAQYTTSVPGGPDGKYVVIRYATSFADKASAVETVTPMVDADGHWHVSGYYIR
jgi:hypothetical protein